MSAGIVFEAGRVTLVGGGVVYPGDLDTALALAPQACAADGGAEALLAAGIEPRAVIGDFDSLSAAARAAIPPQNLVHIAEQDSTDFEKALSRIGAGLVLGVGFTGARMDHAVAVLHGLLRHADRAVVLLAQTEIVLLAPPRLALDLPAGATVSIYPLARCAGRSEGLRWPIDGLTLEAGRLIGTSNRANGGAFMLEMDRPGALLFLPKDSLGAVTQALEAGAPEPARWPARA